MANVKGENYTSELYRLDYIRLDATLMTMVENVTTANRNTHRQKWMKLRI